MHPRRPALPVERTSNAGVHGQGHTADPTRPFGDTLVPASRRLRRSRVRTWRPRGLPVVSRSRGRPAPRELSSGAHERPSRTRRMGNCPAMVRNRAATPRLWRNQRPNLRSVRSIRERVVVPMGSARRGSASSRNRISSWALGREPGPWGDSSSARRSSAYPRLAAPPTHERPHVSPTRAWDSSALVWRAKCVTQSEPGDAGSCRRRRNEVNCSDCTKRSSMARYGEVRE